MASFEHLDYIACKVDLTSQRLRLLLGNGRGGAGTLAQSASTVAPSNLLFAINAGMWETEPAFAPVGLFVSGGVETTPIELGKGDGNFFLEPNGVFFVEDGSAAILPSMRYSETDHSPEIATQSGPMLVIDGEIHPRIALPSGSSLKIRNGVGIDATGSPLFAISREPVSFGWFARLFRDELGCRNALYLDGEVSRIHVPALGITDSSRLLGPIFLAERLP